jgi:hypothetical protein
MEPGCAAPRAAPMGVGLGRRLADRWITSWSHQIVKTAGKRHDCGANAMLPPLGTRGIKPTLKGQKGKGSSDVP